MPRRIIRTATTTIAIAALAAPTALARPADRPPVVAKAAAEQHKQAREHPPVGDTKFDSPGAIHRAAPVGDTKFDSPGANRAPQYDAPRTVTVVRPERTIVRDTDPVLPIALSGLALLVALGLAGTALIRVRSLRLG
jgi:hypothetical protein